MMTRTIQALVLLFYCASMTGQLSDDFTDGNLNANPAWNGDIAHFIVNGDRQLQLNAPAAGTSLLYTDVTLPDRIEWRFWLNLAFAPSASNQVRIYLMADQSDLSLANGYYLEIGENGSADALRLLKLTAGTAQELGASAGIFSTDPVRARVRVTRDAAGSWEVSADLFGGEDFATLYTATDATHAPGNAQIFGLWCAYTETRKDKFFFDDIYAGPLIMDTTPPTVVQVTAEDADHIRIQYSEDLDPATGLLPMNYNIIPFIGTPSSVIFSGTGQAEVLLTIPQTLSSGSTYQIAISDITDPAGNTLDTIVEFQYVTFDQPLPYDILINEIMADPTPIVGQPDAEYLELYNHSIRTFQLGGYGLTVGSQTILLPDVILGAGAYLLVVDTDDADQFVTNVLAVNLPTLPNSGTTLELTDDLGVSLHRLSYDAGSYQDPARDDGGWSLELINPLSVCTLSGNLQASNDLTGGTPGAANSVLFAEADTSGPVFLQVHVLSNTILELVFDETLFPSGHVITIDPGVTITNTAVDVNVITLTLGTPLQPQQLYTISLPSVSDCMGNVSPDQSAQFGLAVPPGAGSIILNELLFDPATGGSRYVELYNQSADFIDLHDLVIADIRGDTISAIPVTTRFLLAPQAYVAITPDVDDIRMRYPQHDLKQLVEQSIPAFDRSRGNVTVYTRAGLVLDAFDYDESYHNALLDDPKGVSLERISAALPTQDPASWQSAAQTIGFGTPGLPNSQDYPGTPSDAEVIVEPETFSPDGDGFDDYLTIRFTDPPPGTVAQIRVFDPTGREIARLANNVSVGQEAFFRWDGVNADGARARIGPHIIWVELFGPDGKVKRYKKVCVVAEKL